jgi:hypothetical protein
MTDDSGFAPCVEKGLLSLACCKGGQIRNGKIVNTGLRHRIGIHREANYATDDVYILGVYKNKMLYFAKVTNVVMMEEYFGGMSKGRTDDIYSLVRGKLIRNQNLRNEDVHTEPDRVVKDLAGKYVVLSDDYIYLGEDAVVIDGITQYYPNFQETKVYTDELAQKIVNECMKYRDNKEHAPTASI